MTSIKQKTWMRGVQEADFHFTPVGSHAEASLSGTVATTPTPAANATKIMMQAFTQNIRYTLDGSAPDANTGFQLGTALPNKPTIMPISGGTVKVITETGTASFQYQWGV